MPHGRDVPDWQLDARLLMRPSPHASNNRRRRSAAFPLQRAAPMTRFVSVPVLVMVAVLGASRVARAQEMLPSGAKIYFEKLAVRQDGEYIEPQLTDDTRLRYF